jgi:3-hydroxyacyl-CoA dehydrogenase
MGGAIFRLLAAGAHDLVLCDAREDRVREEQDRLSRRLKRAARRGEASPDAPRTRMESIRFATSTDAMADADMVIEAVPEDPDTKAAVFQDLESVVSPHCLLLSNTSVISVERLARALRLPERFCGLHFFYPVTLIPLIEIVTWVGTPEPMVERLRALCRDLNRTPIVVRDGPGSVINRVLAHYYLEGLYILEEGRAPPSRIDAAARRRFYLGPCESLDALGLDFFEHALKTAVREDDGKRFGLRASGLLSGLIARNRLGCKTGAGIYLYEGDTPRDDAPVAREGPDTTDEAIEERLLGAIWRGACRALHDSLATETDLERGIREVLLMKEGPFSIMRGRGENEHRTSNTE